MSINKKQQTDEDTFGLRGVGPQIARHLARLEIFSVQDLLLHLPTRYQDRTKIQPLRRLAPDEEAVIEGIVTHAEKPQRGRTKFLCELQDETGRIYLRFFHVFRFQLEAFKPGTRLRCYGTVRLGGKGLEMFHPEFRIVSEEKPIPVDQHLTPIYATTEGLSQHMLRKLMSNALLWLEQQSSLQELLPSTLLHSLSAPTLKQAIQFVHKPPREAALADLLNYRTAAQKRLVFEELLAHRLSLLQLKHAFQLQQSIALLPNEALQQAFRAQLSFQLTAAQERVLQDIQQDLMLSSPMLRLVQGDVGSGKTVVAALAMLQAIANGYQVAMMAPTELLAEQHYRTLQKWFEPLGIKVIFLTGNIKASSRKKALQAIADGVGQVVIGTHALFQQAVQFAKLALMIVDEQHRFGVQQRVLLREKMLHANYYPHQLVMTATPIPRTLAMSFYADLDVSIIDELPPGRTPISTSVIAASRREEVVARIREACQQGRQVYWVCPLIEESELLNCQAASKTAEQLQALLPELTIDLIHGRMNATNKEAAMRMFQEGKTNVLVATTVIEVGVDVANASVMVIENAERLGLSQLHQLRGRVGRGAAASYCILLYQYPLSKLAKERLAVMRETTDGFKIAQRDLELRGPGEILGTRQTGELSFRVADLLRDNELLPIVQKSTELIMREHQHLIESLIQRWVGNAGQYGKV